MLLQQQPQQKRGETTELHADDWKRKLQREIKVNQELGRRIRELKQLLHDEKVERQLVATQLQDYKAQHQCDTCALKKECTRCLELEQQVGQLKRLLAAAKRSEQPQTQQHSLNLQQESNQELDDSTELEATVAQSEDDREGDDNVPHTASAPGSIERCKQQQVVANSDTSLSSAAIADMLKLTTSSEASRQTKVGDSPETFAFSADSERLQLSPRVRALESASPLPQTLSAPLLISAKAPPSNQQQQQRHRHGSLVFNTFDGLEDNSLGDLFKYAVVLAGPAPDVPAQRCPPPPPPCKSFAAYRRTRSLPEGHQQQQRQQQPLPDPVSTSRLSALMNPSLPDESSLSGAALPLATPSKFKLLGGTRQIRSQTLLEFIAEEQPSAAAPPSPTPQRKPGWLSNVAQRFRGAALAPSPAPAATAEAPARLSSLPLDPSTGTSEKTLQTGAHANCSPVSPAKPASKMLCVFPPQTKEVPELEGLVELCFPYGERLPPASDFTLVNLKRTLQERHRTYRSADSTFVLTLASASHPCEITYAICVICPLFADNDFESHDECGDTATGAEAAATESSGVAYADTRSNSGGAATTTTKQCCLCLLSPYPFFSLFFKVLFGIAALWESKRRDVGDRYALAIKQRHKVLPKALMLRDFVEHFETILTSLQRMRVPAMGGWSRMSLAPAITQLSFHRPHSESVDMERRALLLEYAAPTLFALLSVDQVLFLLGCLCCEHKVLVVSDHVNVVSSCVLALITLLSPLQWAGPVITVLPPRLDELLEAPVPLIAGRVSIASASIPRFSTLQRPMRGVIEMNMDQNNVVMHDDDLGNYHELKLPGCDALVHELQFFSAQLFRKHVGDPDFPSAQQTEASEIICTRILRHLEFICALALGTDDDAGADGSSTSDGDASAWVIRTAANNAQCDQPAARRCSDLTLDYIRRFKETQMFSVFRLQRQEQAVATRQLGGDVDAIANDELDDELDDDDDDDEDAEDADVCTPSEYISYEPDALC